MKKLIFNQEVPRPQDHVKLTPAIITDPWSRYLPKKIRRVSY